MTKLTMRIAAVAFLLNVLSRRVNAFCFKTKFKHRCSLSEKVFSPRVLYTRERTWPIFSKAGGSSESVSLEEFDWDAIARDVFETDKRPVILFDGVCNLCNGGVNFALDNDSVGRFALTFSFVRFPCIVFILYDRGLFLAPSLITNHV